MDASDRRALEKRPRTRDECIGGFRPCPWVGCRHHGGIEITESGTIIYTDPTRPPWEAGCTLDRTEEMPDGMTLAEVAFALHESFGRTRELERRALLHSRSIYDQLKGEADCDLCGDPSVGWLSACREHLKQFSASRAGRLAAEGKVDLLQSWEAWVEHAD